MNLSKSRLAVAIMAVTTPFVNANTDSGNNQYSILDQVTVSASRTEKKVAETAGSVTVIDQKKIDKNLFQDIGDLVKHEPGVTVKTEGGRFGLNGFNIRGMEGDRVKIMVDGQSMPKSFKNGTYLNAGSDFVDIETLKRVEIVKGPSSTMNGSDAMAGTVAFVTKEAPPSDFLKAEGDDSYASIKSGYSSANQGFTNTLTFANRSDRLESMFIYTRRDGKETQTHGSSDGGYGASRGKADSQDIAGNNYLGKLQYQLTDSQRLGLTLERYNNDVKGTAESLMYYPDPAYNIEYDKYQYKDKKNRSRIALDHQWNAGIGLFDNLKTTLGWQQSKTDQETELHRIDTDPDMDRFRESKYEQTTWQYSMVFDKSLEFSHGLHSFVYGIDIAKSAIKSQRYLLDIEEGGNIKDNRTVRDFPLTDEYNYAAFVSDDILLLNDRLRITPGLRYDYRKIKTDPDALFINNGNAGAVSESSSFSKVTGQLGAVFDFTDNLSGFVQYAQGFRAPKADEMYFSYSSPYYELRANSDLKAETSNNYEIGVRGKTSLAQYEVATFYSDYDNFIEDKIWKEGSKDIYQKQNLAEAWVRGIELKGTMALANLSPAAEGFSLKGSIAFAEGKYENPTNGEQPLNSVAPIQGVFSLAYDAPSYKWGSEATLTLVKGKDKSDIDQSEASSSKEGDQFEAPGYGIVDLTAYYKPMKDLTLSAGLFNLTDKKYWHWNDVRGKGQANQGLDRYTQPGRNIAVSLKWEI